jgi:hypothetical protein
LQLPLRLRRCKHIVATALACLREPESIKERPTLESLLERLDLPQTRGLVEELIAEQPRLMEIVDDYVQRLAEPAPSPQPATPTRRTPVDPASYHRTVRQILRGAVRDWESGRDDDSIQYDLQDLIDKAQDFTEHGDPTNALVALEAITGACVDHWDEKSRNTAPRATTYAMFDFSRGDRRDGRLMRHGDRAKLRGTHHLNRTEGPPCRSKTLSSRTRCSTFRQGNRIKSCHYLSIVVLRGFLWS